MSRRRRGAGRAGVLAAGGLAAGLLAADLLAAGVRAAGLAVTDASQQDLLRAHGGEELPHRQREAIFDERVEDAVGVAPLGDQPGAFEHREVTRD